MDLKLAKRDFNEAAEITMECLKTRNKHIFTRNKIGPMAPLATSLTTISNSRPAIHTWWELNIFIVNFPFFK